MISKLDIYAIGLLVLGLLLAGAEFHGRHAGYKSAKDEFAADALKQAEESRAHEQSERDRLVTVSQNYEQQIAQLRVDSLSRPAHSVRCTTTTPAVPSAGSNPSGSESPSAHEPDRTVERDIGNPIFNYADDFKACAIQVNSLLDAWPR